MSSSAEWQGFDIFDKQLQTLQNFDPMPLLENWSAIIREGNRKGVLSGIDGLGNPMPPLKYRNGKGKRTARRQAVHFGKTYHTTPSNPSLALRSLVTGSDLNLDGVDYQELTGPRLAPRRNESRVITALHTVINHDPATGTWEVIGAWADVVSVTGDPFLRYHFNGMGHNPKYDLRPIRPDDLRICQNYLQAYAKQHLFSTY
jgi:hypothetical protein